MAKTIKTGEMRRELSLDIRSADPSSRTVELSFSSEEPVQRWFGTEILDHSRDAVDLSRLNTRGPLLMDHDTRDQIGVVEKARLDGKRGIATVRFGNSQRAQEIFQDVQDGIRSLVSVGYRINKMQREAVEGDSETMRATSWTPMEISIVSVPADPTVGIGRDNVDARHFLTVVEETAKPNNDTISIKTMETPQAPIPQAPAPAPTPHIERGAPTP